MGNKILGFVFLAVASVMVVLSTGAEAQEPAAQTEKTGGEAVGAEIVHPASWNVEREPYTYDGTYGYTLWYPDTGAAHDHGGSPALRVALAPDLEPEGIGEEVAAILDDYPDLPQKRQAVPVARRHEGVAVGPIPGSTPFTRVYAPVNGRVYSINVYSEEPGEEGLDADDRELLEALRFERPDRAVGAAGLPRANAPGSLYPTGADARAVERQRDGKGVQGSVVVTSGEGETASRMTASGGGEVSIAEGCWRADPDFYVQTQHGWGANSAKDDGPRGPDMPTGWSMIGYPNFWGQYTHGNIGLGRCKEPYNTNDKFAVDYPLNRYDYIFSPFACGTVTFAGRNQTHADYGIFVSIRSCNGKYVNLSAHLEALANGLSEGDKVDRDTLIGYAGDSDGSIDAGEVHLHTAFYRYPKYNPDGSPYAGRGLQVTRNRYIGTAARERGIKVDSRVYAYDKVKPERTFCREGIRCGERFMVSN